MDLPTGWLTDLAVLRLGGARISDRGDHVVIASPDNPGYHWGNFILVTDQARGNDAGAWVELFAATFPGAGHMGIGLPAEPDPAPWAAVGLEVTGDEVMTASALPELRPLPAGYVADRLMEPVQWRAAAEADIAENARTGEHPDGEYREFANARWRTRSSLSVRGAAAFFGAFEGGLCVSQLGIVLCGRDADGQQLARYQSVQTAYEHRGRGLAGHLLGVAARWALQHGAGRLVIVTESVNPAGRLYRSVGFAPDDRVWQAARSR